MKSIRRILPALPRARSFAIRWATSLAFGLALFLFSTPLRAQDARPDWTERSLELAGSLLVQDGGRVKPLSTYANFTLLGISGRRSFTDVRGERRGAVEFVLDALYFPRDAAGAPMFLVNDSAVALAIGLDVAAKHKRDRYTFHELEPGLPKLFALAHDYAAIDAKRRSSVQQEVVLLAERVDTFLRLNRQETLALIPPDDALAGEGGAGESAGAGVWLSPARAFAEYQAGVEPSPAHQRAFAALDALAQAHADPLAFERALENLHATFADFAAVRAAAPRAALEQSYYRLDLLGWSLGFFLGSFLTAAVTWLRPSWRRVHQLSVLLATAGALALAAAIAMRCTIRGRPPVSTLYETVLFVTAVVALVALALEWIERKRLASAVAAFAGTVGLFIANGYETLDAKDTMPSLVAVLDTNFWLATHVTAITIGYSAGMLAALLGSVYVLLELVRPSRRDSLRSLGGMTYGVLCFGLFFSTVGTILGGIWANESWGRFWGWDPKENGALLIVISQLLVLHARLGGFLRERGVAAAAAASGCVVAFSWWGVNLLGVGLHSYGFTSGIQRALTTYYCLQGGVVLLSGWTWWRARGAVSRRENSGARADAPDTAGARRAA